LISLRLTRLTAIILHRLVPIHTHRRLDLEPQPFIGYSREITSELLRAMFVAIEFAAFFVDRSRGA
jgi:hypothetical protein